MTLLEKKILIILYNTLKKFFVGVVVLASYKLEIDNIVMNYDLSTHAY